MLGENGAGKSTLMKILSGFQPADSGRIWVDGSPIAVGSPADASAAGIGMLHQDPLVFLPMSVLENYMLANPAARDRSRAKEELAAAAGRFGFALDPDTPVRRLSIGRTPAAGGPAPDLGRRAGAHPRRANHGDLRDPARRVVRHPASPRRRRDQRDLRLPQARRGRGAVHPGRGDAGGKGGRRSTGPLSPRRPGRADVRQPGRAGSPAAFAGGGDIGALGGGHRRRPPGAAAPCRPDRCRRRGVGAGRHRGQRPAATLAGLRRAPPVRIGHLQPGRRRPHPTPVTGSGSTPASDSSPPTAPRKDWSVG